MSVTVTFATILSVANVHVFMAIANYYENHLFDQYWLLPSYATDQCEVMCACMRLHRIIALG